MHRMSEMTHGKLGDCAIQVWLSQGSQLRIFGGFPGSGLSSSPGKIAAFSGPWKKSGKSAF